MAGVGDDSSWLNDGAGYGNGSLWILLLALIIIVIASMYAGQVMIIGVAFIIGATLTMWFGPIIGICAGLAFIYWINKSEPNSHKKNNSYELNKNDFSIHEQTKHEPVKVNVVETYPLSQAKEYKISKGISSRDGDNLIKRDMDMFNVKKSKITQNDSNSDEKNSLDKDFLKTRIKTRK
ncbi:hypothetical protein [Lutibacter sp.]|uniref:hypothetical protein n=1 Tax=Lutibacter sp. TaxID=1925666 RepID=UPI00273725D0|nr:hypothetical protein [Lutibacter sp.]MDP3311991.1 hypothetical protein [Lutibacter sp.]